LVRTLTAVMVYVVTVWQLVWATALQNSNSSARSILWSKSSRKSKQIMGEGAKAVTVIHENDNIFKLEQDEQLLLWMNQGNLYIRW